MVKFVKLNNGWNAEPNAPAPVVSVDGWDVVLRFFLNPFMFHEFQEEEIGVLRFVNAARYRLGATNDEGFYRGQCRFSKIAPAWGEFYWITGPEELLSAPKDWILLKGSPSVSKHYLFYLRDHTFECVAERCVVEPCEENGLFRTHKRILVD
jgi:hypothetical protein